MDRGHQGRGEVGLRLYVYVVYLYIYIAHIEYCIKYVLMYVYNVYVIEVRSSSTRS